MGKNLSSRKRGGFSDCRFPISHPLDIAGKNEEKEGVLVRYPGFHCVRLTSNVSAQDIYTASNLVCDPSNQMEGYQIESRMILSDIQPSICQLRDFPWLK